MKLLAQGAEAKIYLEKNTIVKERVPKLYRIKELDEKIRKLRTRREINALNHAIKLIPVPKLIINGKEEREKKITMEYIEGKQVVEVFNVLSSAEQTAICEKIGKNLAVLHNNDLIHGDLTTSNMILKEKEVYFIDFGLSFIDQKPEHKAVDLHLLKQAFESKHYQHLGKSLKQIIDSYKKEAKHADKILERLEKVEKRGHYKIRQ
ncbi:Kae1-associated serine/threonine protein kinase [Candidatus Woesearchaeota archaeon]|nr:Kae1-associated serine/threonine protein kinase [Candidatus Woesearchaeota archaeon]